MNFLGRYASVIVTTIVFVALVVGVLGTNFYLSFQTEANAEVVNIAGRQRMLSQRIAKSLGNVRFRFENQQSFATQLDELKSASQLFDTTVNAFKNGGTTKSTKQGTSSLTAVSGASGILAVDEALAIWQPLLAKINKITTAIDSVSNANAAGLDALSADLKDAQAYTDANINTLLKLMNDLTNYTEGVANDAADNSRLIQTLGIIASLVCFAVIMYLIFGQLRVADRAALNAKQETERIFDTVNQGLFLVNQDGRTGSQQSKALESIFGNKLATGESFKKFIQPLISMDDISKVERYLKLLFDPHKKQRLLTDLNPLNKLQIQIEDNGHITNKYLNFGFTRVMQDDEIVSILTSVDDISKEVKLEKELEAETARNEQQLEMVRVLLGADGELLPVFLKNSSATYSQINDILKDPAKTSIDFKSKAESILTLIHKTKGESAAMGLSIISDQCQKFEDEVERLVNTELVGGDDFLTLTIMLERLFSTNEQIYSVFDVLGAHRTAASATPINTDSANTTLTELAQQIAARQAKKVNLSLAGFENAELPNDMRLNVVSMASQLLRNALAHGIESPTNRQQQGKNEHGKVTLALFSEGRDSYRLICEDDGSGFDFSALAESAIEAGLISAEQRDSVTSSQLAQLVLSSKLSSKQSADDDAGRGVGLKVVSDLAKKLGGKVSLQTKLNEGTRFTVRFSALANRQQSLPNSEASFA